MPADPTPAPPPDGSKRAEVLSRLKSWINDRPRWEGYMEAADASRAAMDAPPEWAVEMAKDYFGRPHVAWTKKGERGYFPDLARLLASVREGALREAAGVIAPFPGVVHSIANPCDACQFAYTTGSLDATSAIHAAILSLLSTPPVPPQEGV